jgi:hypothetical protein
MSGTMGFGAGAREASVLVPIAFLHVALVLGGAAALPARSAGIALGGLAIGGATLLFWAIGRALVAGSRRSTLAFLAALKISAYLLLVGAAFSGWLRVDGLGFAVGITCFPTAVVVGTLYASAPRWRTVPDRWSTGSPG